jgi:hypothetical protein
MHSDTKNQASPQVTDVRNAVTNDVVTGGVTLPHTTPHHTTKNITPVVTEDWGSPAARAAAADIHPLDAMAVVVGWLRPDWDQRHIRTVLARMTVPWRDRALAALRAATDERIRTPWAIENLDVRPYEPTPIPPPLHEVLARIRALDDEPA